MLASFTSEAAEDRWEGKLQVCERLLQLGLKSNGEHISRLECATTRLPWKRQLSLPGHHTAGGVIGISAPVRVWFSTYPDYITRDHKHKVGSHSRRERNAISLFLLFAPI